MCNRVSDCGIHDGCYLVPYSSFVNRLSLVWIMNLSGGLLNFATPAYFVSDMVDACYMLGVMSSIYIFFYLPLHLWVIHGDEFCKYIWFPNGSHKSH